MSRQLSWGHGTTEIRDVTRLLEQSQIPCCIVGVSALMFYGAPRVRDKWEICIPSEMIDKATDILRRRVEYVYTNEKQDPQPLSFAHTYTWFQGNVVDYKFCLVPSTHARIAVERTQVCRSCNGVPYAPLKELVQSFLDINDVVSLCDIVDGANLSYSWGKESLDLSGTTDKEWAQQRNTELMGGNGKFEPSLVGSIYPTARIERKFLWEKTIKEKEQRLAQSMLPTELFETRFMLKGKSEPWNEWCEAC